MPPLFTRPQSTQGGRGGPPPSWRTLSMFVVILLVGILLGRMSVETRWETELQSTSGMLTLLADERQATEPPPPTQDEHEVTKEVDEYNGIMVGMTEGDGWSMWDRKTVLYGDMEGLECNWSEYKPAYALPHVPSKPMCLHARQKDKTVSGDIMDKGRWADCDALTPLLREHGDSKSAKVHFEVGANIGSCVMQVLLTTNAIVYAFEPHPHNLFVLTSTLLNLDESYRDRVHLFPLALGAGRGSSSMSIHSENAGNAQVKRLGATTRKRGVKVQVERLDDIMQPQEWPDDHNATTSLPITLMKMDAQGYECFINQGMTKILQQVQTVVFEVEKRSMQRFKDECTPAILVQQIKDAGFHIQRLQIEGKDAKHPDDLPDFDKMTYHSALDLVGRRQPQQP